MPVPSAEVVEHGVTGGVFASLAAMQAGLPQACSRSTGGTVRAAAVARFRLTRMVEAYETIYRQVLRGAGPDAPA